MPLKGNTELSVARHRAASFESTLDSGKRKRLGQFFTGLPLARILAALSIRKNCRSVIDPMAGHGDLLDAVFERCLIEDIPLLKVDAIEIDTETTKVCRDRLQTWQDKHQASNIEIYGSSAFESDLISALPADGYDLVITNPPYVRYQTITDNGRVGNGDSLEKIRETLLKVVSDRIPRQEHDVWCELVQGFSGLSDLSVPAWLLAAMLVKPGGVLALVAPATWRNRNYADVLQYLLARCFQLETVIADRQPGWFSEALVRTNLVVATRLSSKAFLTPLCWRGQTEHRVFWTEVDQIAKEGNSLVGAAFADEDPEGKFAQWLLHDKSNTALESKGIIVTKRLEDGVSGIRSIRQSSWLKRLESFAEDSPLFSSLSVSSRQKVPHELEGILPNDCEINLDELSKVDIQVGQGLRTGCNGFFYVDMVEQLDQKTARILVSDMLGGDEIVVPIDVLKPVLRRQSELEDFKWGLRTPGYVLDLRGYVLPEDLQEVKNAYSIYKTLGVDPPNVMPKALVDLVRRAAQTPYGSTKDSKCIPELSAVKTNARESRSGPRPKFPRFWYMIPDFMRRHLPDAFVPRVNQDTPWVLSNRKPPLLIDANFSTLWAKGKPWTPESVIGMMNSAWARACMEAIGTPMGGGALKLEATHLRRIPIPKLSISEIEGIAEVGQKQSHERNFSTGKIDEIDHIIVNGILHGRHDVARIDHIINELYFLIDRLKKARQRG